MTPTFIIGFTPDKVSGLLERYCVIDAKQDYTDAMGMAAGEALKTGPFREDDVFTIYNWKNAANSRFKLFPNFQNRNTVDEIEDAFRLAISAKTDRAAMAVLMGLNYVSIPTASAFLTALFPEQHTVIDILALRALGLPNLDKTIDRYIQYRDFCLANYAHYTESLRDFDRCLWQFGKEKKRRL